ncbi:MAG: hypothetical protein HYY50_05230 [Candidatus Kerfeldbacteria bacterium]|nr:hypothetical protein [Candidatus Kerfeldbacteria bacterium]
MQLFGQVNEAVFDWPWSGIHSASGLFIGLLLVVIWNPKAGRFWMIGVSLLVLWELAEITLRYLDVQAHEFVAPLKQAVGGFAFAPETPANVFGDLVIGFFGLMIGRAAIAQRSNRKRPGLP